MDQTAKQQASAKHSAGVALAASTNHIKSFCSLLPAEAEPHRAKLKEKIPTIPGGWVTAQDWLNTLGPLDPVLSDSQATKYYRLLRESRETAQAFMTLDDFACPVALHIGYLDSCEARKTQMELLRVSGLDVERERRDLRTAMQGHHQQLAWDMVELAKALKNAGGDARADAPRLYHRSRH